MSPTMRVVAEAHALDDDAVAHVQAGNDAAAQHASASSSRSVPSSRALPSDDAGARRLRAARRRRRRSRTPPEACQCDLRPARGAARDTSAMFGPAEHAVARDVGAQHVAQAGAAKRVEQRRRRSASPSLRSSRVDGRPPATVRRRGARRARAQIDRRRMSSSQSANASGIARPPACRPRRASAPHRAGASTSAAAHAAAGLHAQRRSRAIAR